MVRKPRRLSEEDRDLWERVTAQATPLHPARPKHQAPEVNTRPVAKPKPAPRAETAPLPAFRVGQHAKPGLPGHDLLPPVAERVADAPLRMDRKRFQRMKRGKMDPDARIDLHGMTAAVAHPALIRFVLGAHASGHRLVLVITGKGRTDRGSDGPMPVRQGMLRHSVPQWLAMPPLGPMVLQVTEAHRSHGGGGAYYVYLRKPPGGGLR
jgi:DNA-nicking Smr family endonuclease